MFCSGCCFVTPIFQPALILVNYSVLKQSLLSQQSSATEARWAHNSEGDGLKPSSANKCNSDLGKNKQKTPGK